MDVVDGNYTVMIKMVNDKPMKLASLIGRKDILHKNMKIGDFIDIPDNRLPYVWKYVQILGYYKKGKGDDKNGI